MKSKKFLRVILSLACVLSAGFALSACGDGEKGEKGDQGIQGIQGMQGEKGEKGDQGAQGANGVTPQLRINQNTNEWEVSYDNGATWSSLGVKATGGENTQTESKLQFQRIAGKDEYRVIGLGTETELDIVIPSTYNGLPVTEIGESAFPGDSDCGDFCAYIQSVVIPDSVKTIGSSAFDECSSLTSVIIPDSVTTIGTYAFYGCSSLTSVIIPDSVTTIGTYAFSDCSSLTNITVNENNANYQSIDGNLYTKDGKTLVQYAIGKTATSFTIPNSVTTIGDRAFWYCSSLTSVVIPDSVTSIGNSAFYYCESLTSVVIPDSVTSIGNSAFSYCGSLTSVVIPDSVTTIGTYAFSDCSSLTSVVFEDTTTWYRTSSYENFINKTGGEQMDVTNAQSNASSLKNSYFYWYKK